MVSRTAALILQVGLSYDRAGQLQQPGTDLVAFADGVLYQILTLRQRGHLPEDGGCGKVEVIDQSLQGPFGAVVRETFQDLQGAEDAGDLFFCHERFFLYE